MHTTASGHRAEIAAARYLKSRGYLVHALNHKQPTYEIDIIASWQRCLYFIEVKYRRSAVAGRGLEYVTATKLHQMAYAARSWVRESTWCGEYQLGVIEVFGPAYAVTACIVPLPT